MPGNVIVRWAVVSVNLDDDDDDDHHHHHEAT